MKYHLTMVFQNKKLGPMPASTTSAETCPNSCPFNHGGGCYAKQGPLAIHWSRVTRGVKGDNFRDFVTKIRRLPNMIWRFAQAGDLPGVGDDIDHDQMIELAKANHRRPVLAYTHKPLTTENSATLKEAEELGFHVNISTESMEEADAAIQKGFSAVTVIPSKCQRGRHEPLADYKDRIRHLRTPAGVKVAVCPATYTETNCLLCGACAKRRPGNTVIAFPAHGTKRNTVDARLG